MTRAEKIQSMTTEELALTMFKHSIDQTVGFIRKGGAGCMNFIETREWLDGEYQPDDKILNGKPIGEDEE